MIDRLLHSHDWLLVFLPIIHIFNWKVIDVFRRTIWEIWGVIEVFKMIFIYTILDSTHLCIFHILILVLVALIHWVVNSHWRTVVFVILIFLLIWCSDVRCFHRIVHRVLIFYYYYTLIILHFKYFSCLYFYFNQSIKIILMSLFYIQNFDNKIYINYFLIL